MEGITQYDSPGETLDKETKQPNPFILALLLTSLLYLNVRPTEPSSSIAATPLAPTTVSISEPVANAVVQDLSKRSGLPPSKLRIVQARPLTWIEHCIGLSDSHDLCSQAIVPGWQVMVSSQSHHWIYRTDASGSIVKLYETTAPKKQIQAEAIALQKS